MSIAKDLLDILRCPKCKGVLMYRESACGLDCEACGLRFAVEDDIPIMLTEEAKPIPQTA